MLTYGFIAAFAIVLFKPASSLHPTKFSLQSSRPTVTQAVKADKTTQSNALAPSESKDELSAALFTKIQQAKKAPPPPDCAVEACVALTFDDGPRSDSTPRILDVLEKEQVHATFFVVGKYVVPNAPYMHRIYADGNEIGNHSWGHANFTKIPPEQMKEQVGLTQAAVQSIGLPAPFMFRPPYMAFNDTVKANVDMPFVLWNVDTRDWADKDPALIANNIETHLHPGAILVLHDENTTANAIAGVIQRQKSKYRFVTVSQLLGINPTSRGVFRGR